MKKLLLVTSFLGLLTGFAGAQLQNNAAYIKVSSGSYLVALNGVINTNGGTLTVDGTLRTPADLTNTAGATLQGDGQYFIGGNWTNDAVFNAGISAATFTGDQGSTVTSGGDAFYDLLLDKTTNDLTLADDMNVANTLDFQAADNYIVLDNNNLQVLHITGYDATRHVRSTGTGFLVRTVGGSPVVFPVGNTSYNPATLSNAGASDLYFVRVADAVLSDGDAGAPLTADAVDRTWFIEEGAPGGSDLTLEVQWNGGEELTGFDHTASYVSHYTGGSWDAQPVVSATGADPYTLTRTGIATLSPFAVFGGGFVPVIDISGIILWEHDGVSGVQNANVALTGDAVDNTITPSDGTFTLTANNGSNFTVTPTKNINKLNGVTVADALAIQQHVAGNVPITSPYKQVAADVNKSNSITGFDATIINQSLLGNPSALNQFKTSWRFVPVSYAMSVPPWGFPEKINLAGVSGNTPDQDFWGIKTGDVVDVYADPANLVPPPPLVLRAGDRVLQAGEEIAVDFRADQFEDLAAWQFALRFDPDRLQLGDIKPLGGLPLTTDDFGVFDIADGEVRSIWSRATGVAVQEAAPVFQLHFKVLQDGGVLSDALYLDETALRSIAYNSNMQESEVQLQFSEATTGTGQVADATILLRNRPNPFADETTIEFSLPDACEAQLRIYDATGRELWQFDKYYPAGYHAERVNLEGVTAAGVLYYELTTPYGTRTKRMVRVGR
ncbi:MAG: T9SS type A sorting domain-containing protein [Lewinellaceae bacterium]|nr:T9SS type A sorting domain-containing protein [Lewinellaceae bacterium]